MPTRLGTALSLFAIGGRLAAQVSVEVGPVVGYYAPMPAHSSDGANAPGNFGAVAWGVGGPPELPPGPPPRNPFARRFQCDGLVHVALTWNGP